MERAGFWEGLYRVIGDLYLFIYCLKRCCVRLSLSICFSFSSRIGFVQDFDVI